MFFNHHRHSRVALQIADGLLAFISIALAYWIRVYFLPVAVPLESREIGQGLIYLPYAILWPLPHQLCWSGGAFTGIWP